MITKNKIRQKLIKKINRLSDDKLNTLENYVEELEKDINSKSEILSFAGILKDIDSETLDNLTTNLHRSRLLGKERIQ